MNTGFTFGTDYYPEHWPRQRWEQDAAMMEKLGIEVVRMGEFSWCRFEPEDGEFEFDWLDEAIELLGRHSIRTIVGTPTASPPVWLAEKYPEILPMDENGTRKSFGGRHHDCQSNPQYRHYVRRLVRKMVDHYSANENVVGWQVDNELGNSHEGLCMCDSCRNAFHGWLEARYGRIEKLNEAWGTAFWSQVYSRFDQIPAPRKTPTAHSPSLLLDWKRFCSDLVVDFSQEQVRILRELCPHQFITHNCMGIHPKTDYFKLAEQLDFVSNDQYPTGFYFDRPEPPAKLAAYLDFIRGLKEKNFWMMELQAGATGGDIVGKMPEPGQLKLWAFQIQPHHPGLSYDGQILSYYKGFWQAAFPLDFTCYGRDWRQYRLLLAPLSMLMDERRAAELKAYVKAGGTLLLTMRSGVKEESNICFTEGDMPHLLERLAGVKTVDYDCLLYDGSVPIMWGEGADYCGCKWVDILEAVEASVLATFTDGWYQGRPAVTRRNYGKGRVYYVATEPDEALMKRLVQELGETCMLQRFGEAEEGVELAVREGRRKDYLFVMNHNGTEKKYRFPAGWKPEDGDERTTLHPYECRIYTRSGKEPA